MKIRTERLYFSKFDPSYTKALFALDNDPVVNEFINGGDKTFPWTGYEEMTIESCKRFEKWGALSLWPVHEIDGNEFIGWMALKKDNQFPGEIEVGYRLRKEHWGKGYATEGAAALLRYGFEDQDLEKIISHTLLKNVRSQNVMKKIGLNKECDFIYRREALPDWDDDRRRGVKYSISRESWSTKNP